MGRLVVGRVTFEGFAEAWPSRDGEFADKYNGMSKYVVSTTLQDPDWSNSTVIDGDVAGTVSNSNRSSTARSSSTAASSSYAP
ncbi:MAG: hypothetical protein NVSMB25_23210 [Thermoleophilaceae bacterium]